MRIVFWGTPEFALPSLSALARAGHTIAAAVTRPDRPAGRGRRSRPSPVKRLATEMAIPVLQPETTREPCFVAALRSLEPDLSVVVAYGGLLPENVLTVPRLGSVNLHASLLPELRGAAPINWAIIRGDRRTGVTAMRMVRELDAGPVLRQVETEITPETTAGELSRRLSRLGSELLVECAALMAEGTLPEREQEHAFATFAPKLDRSSARLDWSCGAEEVARWVRGCDPWPGAWSELDGRPVQLFAPSVVDDTSAPTAQSAAPGNAAPGTVARADPRSGLIVVAGCGALRIAEVKPAGRSRMPAAAWVRGRGVREGQRFT